MFWNLKPSSLAFAFALCLASAAPSAFGQSTCPSSTTPPPTDPLHTIIAVHFDASTGNITVGNTTYSGQNPGFHLLALKRQPNSCHLDAPDLIQDQVVLDAASANQFLQNVLASTPDALLLVNGVGNYGFSLSVLAQNLASFGSYPGLELINSATSFIFIGNGGRKPQTALQRGYDTRNLDGYLAQDSHGNYSFTQMDFVRYDLNLNGSITVGSTTYTVADSYKPGCNGDGQNAFHLVKVDREEPSAALVNNTYCTAQSDTEIQRLIGDINNITKNVTDESALIFLASNGHPIPANWGFGTDGDPRIYPLAQQIAKLGGYWETMAYLTPNDTYSLVGAPPPPAGTSNPRQRARESSSVYPANVNGESPTGELHGVLARGRGNWYSPLNADPSGYANLGLYEILAQAPVAFPHPSGQDEIDAFWAINLSLCQHNSPNKPNLCPAYFNIRNSYQNINISWDSSYLSPLQTVYTKDANGNDCTQSSNASLPYCAVRAQLLSEFTAVNSIKTFYGNVTDLWAGSGTVTLGSQLSAFTTVKNTLPQAPAAASSSSLTSPLVNLFLGLASAAPEVGPIFGLADVFFNFGTALTTDPQGNKQIDLDSTIGQLLTQATDQFIAQAATTGTLFEFIFQDWGKISTLGPDVAITPDQSGPWYWSTGATSRMLLSMTPAIQQAAYQSIMPAAYAIGSYLPQSSLNCYGNGPNPVWGQTPLWQQPRAYTVLDTSYNCGNLGNTPVVQPFAPPNNTVYIPYTYPNDAGNPNANDPRTGTILADYSWLAISSLNSQSNSGPNQHYDPPDLSLLSTLFTPVSQGGVGVYRPAFFDGGWPFPRVTCDPSYGVYPPGQPGMSVGGCNWSAANPVTGPVSPGPSVTSITMQANQIASNGNEVDVRLILSNDGTVAANSIDLTSITLRTLAGSGQATVISPTAPMQVSSLVPGDSANVILKLNVPTSITKLSLTEAGTVDVGQPQPVQISQGQVLYPQR